MPQAMESHLCYANARFNAGRSYLRSPSHDDGRDNFLRMRCILKNQLNQGQMPNMPAGFPFHYVMDGSGCAYVSEAPYEFEERCLSMYGGPAEVQTATFSFMDPATSSRTRGCNKYIWKIALPGFESEYPDDRGA